MDDFESDDSSSNDADVNDDARMSADEGVDDVAAAATSPFNQSGRLPLDFFVRILGVVEST